MKDDDTSEIMRSGGYLSVAALMKAIGYSRSRVYAAVKREGLKVTRVSGAIFIHRTQLDVWLKAAPPLLRRAHAALDKKAKKSA